MLTAEIKEQFKEAPPSYCRRCRGPIYWQALKLGKRRPVDALTFGPHYCRFTDKNTQLKEKG